jgi:hypothetical protein
MKLHWRHHGYPACGTSTGAYYADTPAQVSCQLCRRSRSWRRAMDEAGTAAVLALVFCALTLAYFLAQQLVAIGRFG